MNPLLITLGVIALLVIFIISKGLMIVQQSETVVIERLGKYYRTLSSGINVIIPFIDRPRPINQRILVAGPKGVFARFALKDRIDLRESVLDFAKQSVITRDNVMTEINAILYFQIVDPVRALYEIENLPLAIEKLTQTSLRNIVGEMDLDETLTSRDTINSKLRDILDEATNKWGVKVNRVELQEIDPPREIRDAMEKQMRAERDKRAQILAAEGQKEAVIRESEGIMQQSVNHAKGEKEAQILAAEAEKQAQILHAEALKQAQILEAEAERQAKELRAQGDADAIRLVTEAVKGSGAEPTQYLIAMKYLEVLGTMGQNAGDKTVFLPFEATGILGALGGIKEISGNGTPLKEIIPPLKG